MIIYLLAMSGVMIHAHYCSGNLESWNVYQKSSGCEDEICDDESEDADGCCKDKLVVSKVVEDQNHTDAFKLKVSDIFFETPGQNYFSSSAVMLTSSQQNSISYQPNAPPGLWENIPLYKLHSGFIYYG